MANKLDKNRKEAKAQAVIVRLDDIRHNLPLLIGMLDEAKLDMLVLALGIGSVTLTHEP